MHLLAQGNSSINAFWTLDLRVDNDINSAYKCSDDISLLNLRYPFETWKLGKAYGLLVKSYFILCPLLENVYH